MQSNATWTKHFISFLSKHEIFATHFSLFRGTPVCPCAQFGKPPSRWCCSSQRMDKLECRKTSRN